MYKIYILQIYKYIINLCIMNALHSMNTIKSIRENSPQGSPDNN